MKCKQCGKTVRSISHWAREHKKWLASRKRKPRGKASRKAGKAPKTSRKRRRAQSTSEAPNDAPDAPAGFVVETVTYRRA